MSPTLGKPKFVWLGAGEAVDSQLLDQFLKQYPQGQITLVEARDNVVVKLQQRYADATNYSVNSAVLAMHTGQSNFYTLNLPEFSSLQQPTGLVSLFPGVAVQKIEPVDTLAVDQYVAELNIESEQPNHLYIDIPAQAGNIVRQLIKHEQLHFFCELHISAGLEALYEEDEKQAYIEGLLAEQGYDVVSTDNADPDIPVLSLKLNPLWQKLCAMQLALTKVTKDHTQLSKQFELVSSQLSEKTIEVNKAVALIDDREMQLNQQAKQAEELKKQLDAKTAQNTDQHAQLAIVNQQIIDKTTQLAEQKKQTEEFKKQLDDKAAQIANQHAQLEAVNKQAAVNAETMKALQQQLVLNQTQNDKLSILEEKFIQMMGAQSQCSQQIQQAANALGQHITKSISTGTQQLEAYMGVQSLLELGEVPLKFHGWSINPDLALILADKIKSNNYDLIIEFGSGSSTLLFAKSIMQYRLDNTDKARLSIAKRQVDDKLVSYVEPEDYDLPKHVISFEQNKEYFKQTEDSLNQQGLLKAVELVYSPLVNMKDQGDDYLYYNCKTKLKHLARVYENRSARILVLVDGPYDPNNYKARYPALPLLLKYLPAHQLDIVLDDYNREGEQKSAEKWCDLLDTRNIDFKKTILPCEKGALLLSINS